jgi:hypothetical protein
MTDDTDTTTGRTDLTGRADSAAHTGSTDQTARRAVATDGGTDPDTTTVTGTDPTAPPTDGESTGARLRRLVDYLALAGLALLALVAGVQVYAAIDATISRFVVREYQPLFRGAVNLALLLLAAGGVTLQLRRLR